MEFEVSYTLETEEQFWEELEEIIKVQDNAHQLIDNALRNYLGFVTNYQDEYLKTEYDVAKCSLKLLESQLFKSNKEYIRRQLLYGLLEDDEPTTLQFVVFFLLIDGRNDETAFEMMNDEGAFPRLVELIQGKREDSPGLHRLLLELLYEMSRIQRLSAADLGIIDDKFVAYLFQTTEELSNDVDDPYHYPIIRVLLVLNEQYMVHAHTTPTPSSPLTNKIIKHLIHNLTSHKTFGSNIILLLNRESETSLQLLILKFLYLVFTTPPTHEYFYTNDLRVLVDVIMRNLLDLPDDAQPLRHTYLRVLCPLLAHTQLRREPHYKRDELRRLLSLLRGERAKHFAPVDPTTLRLVGRCEKVEWLADSLPDALNPSENERAKPDENGTAKPDSRSPTSSTENPKKTNGVRAKGPCVPPPRGSTARKLLGMSVKEAQESSLSVVEVAALREKPGVMTGTKGLVNGGR